MGSKARILPNYTYDDYRQWKGRWEIIDGIPFAMSPMPSPKHQRIASSLSRLFENTLAENKNCSCSVYQPIDVKIEETTVVNPDLLIVCQPINKQFLDFPPNLVVEILSPSTRLKDRNSKYTLYERFGIRYYLIIDPDKETIEVYRLNSAGVYELVDTAEFQLTDDCNISPDLSKIW